MIFSYFCIILEKNKADQMLVCQKRSDFRGVLKGFL